MKLYNIKYAVMAVVGLIYFSSCNNDDGARDPMAMAACYDGIMNGSETGVDCGGACEPCTTTTDFSGSYSQVDHMGRPGINTVLGFDMEGEASVKDAQNRTIPSEMATTFQLGYEARLEQYHDVYANLLGADPAEVNYENNILNLTAAQLTGYLAADVLEVAPNLPTTYFNPGTDLDMDGRILVPDGDEVALTGRALTDDVIDVSLILLFGGMEGDRFSGQDLDDDGIADLPRLTSDGVSLTATISANFPYLGSPK
ncbi:DUF4331 domain-containing protein [Arenibacter sp. 6A1]|uniref:DUF4331 family protein n=1 Tax=Arenibacter sp. 6A1 TaxID=2720391 RepID=UPI00144729FE|nr:DUF4331 family protein [Arenibacter sp. 6A1]NKI27204.1 DUF4331 domain-containing protein [Arenibacter sp. 6A1]